MNKCLAIAWIYWNNSFHTLHMRMVCTIYIVLSIMLEVFKPHLVLQCTQSTEHYKWPLVTSSCREQAREREKTSCLLPISEHKIHLIFRHWFTQKLKMIRTISIIDVVFNCEIELESSLWNWVVKIHYHSIWTIESMKSSKLISKILSKMEIHNTKLNRIMHIREDSQIVI